MIQWLSSQALAGNLNSPVKVVPACKRIVSPQLALFRADCSPLLVFTVTVLPDAGVLAIAVGIRIRGNSAGPSKVLLEVDELEEDEELELDELDELEELDEVVVELDETESV